jgi:hypothetical protein
MNLALIFFITIFIMRISNTNGQRIREFVDDGGEDEQQPIQTSTHTSPPTSMPSSSMALPRPVIRMSLDPVEFRKEHILLPQEGLKKVNFERKNKQVGVDYLAITLEAMIYNRMDRREFQLLNDNAKIVFKFKYQN